MRFLIFTTFLCLSYSLDAQYEKGSWYLNGNTSIDFGDQSTVADFRYESYYGSRSGLFVADKLLVGGNLFDLSAFARYYVPLSKSGRLHVFGELNSLFYDIGDGNVLLQPGIGLEYQLAPGVLLSGTLNHTFERQRNDVTSLQVAINSFLTIGKGEAKGKAAPRRGTLFIDPYIGNVTYGGLRNNSYRSIGFDLHLGGMFFVTDQLAVEGSVSLSNTDSDFTGIQNLEQFDRLRGQATLGLRYFLTLQGRLRPYLGGGVNYQYDKSVGIGDLYPNGLRTNIDEGFTSYAKAGVLYSISDRVNLDGGFDLNLTDGNIRVGLGIGLKVRLGKDD